MVRLYFLTLMQYHTFRRSRTPERMKRYTARYHLKLANDRNDYKNIYTLKIS